MYRKKVIIIFVAIIIYILLEFIHSKLTSKNLKEAYVLKHDIDKNQTISLEDVDIIKFSGTLDNDLLLDLNNQNLVAKNNLNKGQILFTSHITLSSNIDEIKDNKECVNINLEDSDKTIDRLYKDSIVNIYYTGRTSQVKNYFNDISLKKIESSSITDGYTTVLLLEDVSIKNVYNKAGEKIDENSNDNLVYSIDVEIEQNSSILIQNIKNFGKFSVSLKR